VGGDGETTTPHPPSSTVELPEQLQLIIINWRYP
jgi:hypothetical protein